MGERQTSKAKHVDSGSIVIVEKLLRTDIKYKQAQPTERYNHETKSNENFRNNHLLGFVILSGKNKRSSKYDL